MHHHTRWFIYFLLLVFIFLMWFFLHRQLQQVPSFPTTTAPVATTNPFYTEKKIASRDNYATYDVVYPQFKNADSTFNKKIEDTVLSAQVEFAQNADANWKAYRETTFEEGDPGMYPSEPYPFYVKWESAQVNADAISILLRIGGYNGGAHGYENIISFNYDVKNHRELSLADFFPNNPGYLKTLSDFSRAELLKTLTISEGLDTMSDDERATYIKESVEPMIDDGTTPVLENFSVFTFSDHALTIYFSQYQVAPYAAGEQTVVYPR